MEFSIVVRRPSYSVFFGRIFGRILQQLLEYVGMGLSYKCFLGLMTITVLKYDKKRYIRGWNECLINMTGAMSGLM